MPSIRYLPVAALALLVAMSSYAEDRTRPAPEKRQIGLFTVVNATFDSVTRMALAPTDSQAFEDVALGESLHGGMTTATVRLPPGECLRDIRVTFRDGRTQVFPGIDVCRSHALRLSVGS